MLRHSLLERELLETLSQKEDFGFPDLSFEKVLDLSEQIRPSEVLGVGGYLFESYIIRYGAKKNCDVLALHLTRHTKLPLAFRKEIVRDETARFWIIRSIHSVNLFANFQLRLFTLLLEYRGLSGSVFSF